LEPRVFQVKISSRNPNLKQKTKRKWNEEKKFPSLEHMKTIEETKKEEEKKANNSKRKGDPFLQIKKKEWGHYARHNN
jgi:hypothetical protein